MIHSHTDVLILGGGPSGLAAAIALRQRGIECTVVEALSPTIDKACGEGLMPDALLALRSLGVALTEEDGYPFRGIRFANSSHQVDAFFPESHGLGVRRTRLHSRLAQHADHSGVRLLWNSRIKLLDRHTAQVNDTPLSFRWLIGADGQGSSVRKWAGLDQTRKRRLRYGFRRHYQIKPWSEYVEVHWGRGGQLYITPVSAECICVVFITRDPKHDRGDILASFPEVAMRLKDARLLSQQRGAVSATCKLRDVADSTVALVGDGVGFHRCRNRRRSSQSFRQAHALAEAIQAGSLEQYVRAHRRIGRLPHTMGSLILTMDRWPSIELRALRALASAPEVFRDFLSVHMGAKSLVELALCHGPRFGWKLIAESR